MSGHSKWHNIARKKGVVDQRPRQSAFTKCAREMAVVIPQQRLGRFQRPNGNPRD